MGNLMKPNEGPLEKVSSRACLFQGKGNGQIVERMESLWKCELPLFGCYVSEERTLSFGGPHMQKAFRTKQDGKMEWTSKLITWQIDHCVGDFLYFF